MAPPNMRLMGLSRIKLTCTSFFIAKCGHIDFPIFGKIARVLRYGSPMAVHIWISCLFFLHNGWRRPFWMSEIHVWSHFWPFQIDTQFVLFGNFDKMSAVGHFGFPKFAFDRISGHIRSIWIFLTKWSPAPILDVRNSLSSQYVAILISRFSPKSPSSILWVTNGCTNMNFMCKLVSQLQGTQALEMAEARAILWDFETFYSLLCSIEQSTGRSNGVWRDIDNKYNVKLN